MNIIIHVIIVIILTGIITKLTINEYNINVMLNLKKINNINNYKNLLDD